MFVFPCPPSLRMIISRSILAAAAFMIPFSCMIVWCPPVHMNLILFIHASADGHLACSLVLAIANGASVDIGVHVCFEGPFFPFDEVQLSVLSFPFGIMFFLSCGRPLCQARGPRGLLQLFFLRCGKRCIVCIYTHVTFALNVPWWVHFRIG
mgnify:FL=1